MGLGKYFRNQFRVQKLFLEHEDVSDFYISCWQKNRTTFPLLCVRVVLFLICLGILLTSTIMTASFMSFGFWPIYMTHWGVVMITVTTGFGSFVSIKAYTRGHIEHLFELPWFVKTYWALDNITTTIAFFITVFYYIFLTADELDFAVDPVLDVLIHAMNSVVMFVNLALSRHPVHLLHFFYPVMFSLVYMIFSVIYYFAGGLDPLGRPSIYPMLNWADPGPTSIMAVVSAVAIIIIFIIVVLLTELRSFVSRKVVHGSKSLDIS